MADIRAFPVRSPAAGANARKGDNTGNDNPPGGSDVEARVAALEVTAKYIERDVGVIMADMNTVKSDLPTIKIAISAIGGGGAVVIALLAWIANNRFDQILGLLAK